MIAKKGSAWVLATPETTYIFRITETGHPEHLYYGPALVTPVSCSAGDASVKVGASAARWVDELTEGDIASLTQKRVFPPGNLISYDEEHEAVTLEDMALEMSSTGKGDVREPFVEVVFADGSRTADFLYDRAVVSDKKPPFETLPGAYAPGMYAANADGFSRLTLTLRDKIHDLELELTYGVFEDCDVITRSSRLINRGKEPVRIERLMSAQLDLPGADYMMATFRGAWAREMTRQETPVAGGRVVNTANAGASSNRANPFVMLYPGSTTEESGLCYASNLIYSGNHSESAEPGAFGLTRFMTGLSPQGFEWVLGPGEAFEAPEAALTCTKDGYTGISRHMHAFVREHIVRGCRAREIRPILLNSWEASYFKITEAKLLKLAKAAKDAGIELFVMDDGWFGQRDDDKRSLGDWTANHKKLPRGLKGISDKVHALGLQFGVWVEPEMVNVDSDLYRAHPEWVMQIPAAGGAGAAQMAGETGSPAGESAWQSHSEGRHQRILDLANPAVVDHLIEAMSAVITEAKADYIKWDMNRVFSDVYSPYLTADRQGETAHRYILGLYRLMGTLTERFPDVLFEGCASGGNRFDLGILCYMPQIWASDNTDAISRVYIEEGYSYGYPMNTVASHVSSVPNHQTLRVTPLATRFAVAAFGSFGFECNLVDMTREERGKIAGMVNIYKKWRDVLQTGDFYRQAGGSAGGRAWQPVGVNGFSKVHQWTCVSKDKKRAVGLVLQELVTPNSPYEIYKPRGLDPDRYYHFYNREEKQDIRRFGDLINTAAPIHVKQDSALHHVIARFYQMPGETEDLIVRGSVLMEAGFVLSPAFAGTGYNLEVRYFQDFSARLYFMEAVE